MTSQGHMGDNFDLEFTRHYCIPKSKHRGQNAVNDGLYSILVAGWYSIPAPSDSKINAFSFSQSPSFGPVLELGYN